MADKVMRMTDPTPIASPAGAVLRTRAYGENSPTIQTRRTPEASANTGAGAGPDAAVHAASQGGAPLPNAARSFFEPRFGHDFSQVRVHTDTQAAHAARALQARAYTVGSDVVFGAGEYAPATAHGDRLLAHELTHVIQQSAANRVRAGAPAQIQRQLFPPIPIVTLPLNTAQALEVNAVDSRQERSIPWYLPWRYTGPLAGLFRGDVEMSNCASMATNVLAFLQGRTMQRLNVMDHGNENGVEIGDDWLASPADVTAHSSDLGRLRASFASGGFVHMQNCHAGQNRPLICALARAFGTPVYAGTGFHNPIYGVNFGDYVRCQPDGSFNPNVGRPQTPSPPPVPTTAMGDEATEPDSQAA